MSVLEAMSCNLPVISTRFGALTRVFSEDNGLFFVGNNEFDQIIKKIKNDNIEIKTREKFSFIPGMISLKISMIFTKMYTTKRYEDIMAKNLKIKNRFICFTGIDGSGKTTACKMSIKMLEKKGMKYDYVYCGWRRFNSLFLVPFVTLLRRSNTLVSNNSGNKKLNYLKNRFPALFQNVVLADYFLSIIFNIKIPLMLGRNIVCDRYVYDVIIGLGIDLGYPDKKIMKILKIFCI